MSEVRVVEFDSLYGKRTEIAVVLDGVQHWISKLEPRWNSRPRWEVVPHIRSPWRPTEHVPILIDHLERYPGCVPQQDELIQKLVELI